MEYQRRKNFSRCKITGVNFLEHEHILPDGTVAKHSHSNSHTKTNLEHEHILPDGTIVKHSHSHTHTQTKAVLNRMSRLIGHLESVKKMIEEGRDCSEVLIQISAVDSALKAVGRIILKDHLEHCIVEAVQEGDDSALDELNKAIDQFLK